MSLKRGERVRESMVGIPWRYGNVVPKTERAEKTKREEV